MACNVLADWLPIGVQGNTLDSLFINRALCFLPNSKFIPRLVLQMAISSTGFEAWLSDWPT